MSRASARDEYFVQVYRQLRQAARNARSVNPQQTMNTTALVHEAWLKLEQSDAPANNRMHYLKTAALAMRQLLVDYARYRGAEKRDRAMELPLFEELLPSVNNDSGDDLLALEKALERLERLDPHAAELVVLRFFGGATLEEAAEMMVTSRRSAARYWARARAYLRTQLAP
ncbi:sigma-70 family RNA polymerase sigma factor [Wenzhouxiangella sp. XN201]|uniref:ECF-type sigma factor n=1 Tax=Wenzhouxiangella sp. XN201 TaxID=2710755 RepID=UPI0013C9DD50|nr:ECF-type sigma factor [Wenzhouxiangella sp. XN201]NEZ04698.1 sigma-70 family RNA polymerase sigma factor [Wenzhouxiangella sp. XN201]